MKNFEELENFIKGNADWLETLKPYLKQVQFVEFNPNWVCVMYNLMELPKDEKIFKIITQCRGTVVDKTTGEIICGPFIKFWNYGEAYADDLDWSSTTVDHKRDGWLTKLFKWQDKIYLATNGRVLSKLEPGAPVSATVHPEYGFENVSDVLRYSIGDTDGFSDNGYLINPPDWTQNLPNGSTVMMELESPWNVIHTHLIDEPKAWLIGYRGPDGIELDKRDAKVKFSIPLETPKVYDFKSVDDMVSALSSWTVDLNGEGVVACDKNFKRIKIKCEDYLRVKYIENLEDISDRTLFRFILTGEIDDLLGSVPSLVDRVNVIKNEISVFKKLLVSIKDSATKLFVDCNFDKKTFAEKVLTYKNKSLYFSLLDKNVEIVESSLLDKWSKSKDSYDDLIRIISE